MQKLRMAQVGCGGMGLRHLHGQAELQRVFGSVDLVAVCDRNISTAEHVASEAEKMLGTRPAVYSDFDELLDKEPELDGVDIVTEVGSHHTLAAKAFDAGVHVAMEKPLGLTVKACHQIIEAAERSGCVLSVSENYRRDPMNLLVKALIDSGSLGQPRLMIDVSTRGSEYMPHSTAWRHIKLRGGALLDYGVHDADMFMFLMGEPERIYAETDLFQRTRKTGDAAMNERMRQMYAHRVADDTERGETIETSSEDVALASVRFKSGALGTFVHSLAAPGKSGAMEVLYCSEGSINLPGARTGNPVKVTRIDQSRALSKADVLALVPDFELDDLTATFFGGSRLSSYDLPFGQSDAKLIALELQDLVNAVTTGSEVAVPGKLGLDAVALVYSILESGQAQMPVAFADVVNGDVADYQQEIDDHAGL
jgi:UDP-N-acetyl-2-amino-2-deoxyglucuronate dehydrogenase